MSVTTEQTESKDFIGSGVSTPDGVGVVTGVDPRSVKVDLADGRKAEYSYRDVSLTGSKSKSPAPAPTPEPEPEPAAPAPEAPAE